MKRRNFVASMVSIIASPRLLFAQQPAAPALPPPAPVPWTLGLNPKTPRPHTELAEEIAQTDQRFFTAAQMATLSRLCDLLLPAIGDKPGAIKAGTPLFLDFLLSKSPTARQKVYAGGLDWLDAESQKGHRKAFAVLNETEADTLLRPWLRTWMNDHPPAEIHARFINIAHDDIRTATLNSEAWNETSSNGRSKTASLYWRPIEPDVTAASAEAAKLPAHVLAAPKASHSIPSYPR
ncbi:MAG: hypothetical protein NVSMB62_13230 [Acidobacteriaceae bacterium]